jgi:hypothetical protein
MKGRGIGSARGRATILRGASWRRRDLRGVLTLSRSAIAARPARHGRAPAGHPPLSGGASTSSHTARESESEMMMGMG